MNFQDYCDKISEVDGQKISINNTFVIGFGNSKGQIFTIDPTVAISFIKFLDQSHAECYSAWKETPKRKENYTQYEEKSYRAIFQAASGDRSLVAISSLGGSQTRPLTELLSKLICYLGQFDYVGVEKNSYFDVASVQKALNAVPSDLSTLASAKQTQRAVGLKERFKAWMRKNKLSEKTISSYSEDSITLANQIIQKIESDFAGLYSMAKLAALDLRILQLEGIEEWKDRNTSGNGMYRAGLNKYKEFIQYLDSVTMINIPKPFLLLAGLSGTGKTRFVRDQASAHRGGDLTNHCLVPVRPDWHEPSDLLGFVSRIGHNGARYVVTDLLRFVVKAWLDAKATANATELLCRPSAEMTPHWLCLDEMNLAPVEQYFADYLSVLETRKWVDGKYECEPLLKSDTIGQLDAGGQDELRKQLGLGKDHDDLWQYFTTCGIPLPPNLIVAGTVNMDETTHGFSRKVIDRAYTIDFGVFFPNDFAEFFEEDKINFPKTLGFPLLTKATKEELAAVKADTDGATSVAFLDAVNAVLKGSPFELAYRALNELLLAVVCFQPEDEVALQAVWDDFLMSKVLPRIDGDAEKLGLNNGVSLLTQLLAEVEKQFTKIGTAQRPDLLREKTGGGVCMVDCRSKQKLAWMQDRLTKNGFTTFWP